MPGRIIQHQQDLPARHVRTPAGGAGFQAGRDLRRGQPGGQQQAGQPIGWVHRPLPGRVSVQRHEELPVREPFGQPVRGVHRETGLADPGHPVDRVNAHHPAAGGRAIKRCHQLIKVSLAAGEGGDIPRQRPGRRRRKRTRHAPLPGRQHGLGRPAPAGRRNEQIARLPVQS